MTEDIEYSGTITGFKIKDVKEIKKIVAAFYNTPISYETADEITIGDVIIHRKDEPFPAEAVKRHFKDFCKRHPHIEVQIMARYIEHTPYDLITIKGNEIEEDLL